MLKTLYDKTYPTLSLFSGNYSDYIGWRVYSVYGHTKGWVTIKEIWRRQRKNTNVISEDFIINEDKYLYTPYDIDWAKTYGYGFYFDCRHTKVGQKVWEIGKQWGTIVDIDFRRECPLGVKFHNSIVKYYTLDGKYRSTDHFQVLFWNKIKFNVPRFEDRIDDEKYDILDEMKYLKEKQFVQGEDNCCIFYDENSKNISYACGTYTNIPNVIYFTKESVLKFIDKIKDSKIDKDKFFKVYNKWW